MLKISYVAQNNWPLATRPQLSQNIQNLSLLIIYLSYLFLIPAPNQLYFKTVCEVV